MGSTFLIDRSIGRGYLFMETSDVNDAETRLSFSEKNEPEPSRDSMRMSPSRTETLAKRARAEFRLLQNITESK